MSGWGPGARHYKAGSYRYSVCLKFVSESIQTLVKHIGRIHQNEPNLHIYMQPIGYKNHTRIFSSVVDASVKISCAADGDGVRKGPIFCYYIDLYCYTEICGSSVQWKDVTVNYIIAKFVLPYMCYI